MRDSNASQSHHPDFDLVAQFARGIKPNKVFYILVAVAIAVATVAMGGGTVQAQTAEQFEQMQQKLEEALKVIEQQQRDIEQQQRNQDNQTRKIEELQNQVEALQPPSQRELVVPPGILTGPLSSEETYEKLADPSAIGRDPERAPEAAYSIAVGGHVNRQVSVADDGDRTKTYHVDSANVPSFAYIKGNALVNEDLTMGVHYEQGFSDNSSLAVNQNNESSGLNTFGRFAEITADSETYGKGSLGKGWASSFYVFELDKSGQAFGNFNAVGQAFPGLLFYDKDLGDYSNVTVGNAFLDIEQTSLINRVRYDSPIWNGFQLSGHLGENQQRGGRLIYNKDDLGDFSISAATSFQNKAVGPVQYRADAGFGILHKPSGLNLTSVVASQEFTDDGRTSDGFTVRPGWRERLFSWGETKTSVDFTRSWDITQSGDTATSIGAFLVQDIDAFGMQLYAGYRYYDLDRDDINLDQIHLITGGVSVPFEFELFFDDDGHILE